MLPVAHTTGFSWDELVIFVSILVAIKVYRVARGPVQGDGDANDSPASPGPEPGR